MAEINKPSSINKLWAIGGNRATPTDAKIDTGWVEEIPPHEYENFLQYRQDQSIAHINQHGICIWDSVTEYQANKSIVQTSDGRVFKAITTNTNLPPSTNASAWFDVNQTGFVVLNSSTTWTVPPILRSGYKKPKVTVTGGGGSGGSGSTSGSIRGAGGGAGATTVAVIDLTGVSSVAVTVGSGGSRRTSQNLDGNGGTQTSFGTYLNANGGGGGGRYATSANVNGGIGGSSSGGSLNLKGGDGSDGPRIGSGADGGSGDGGASFWGGGIRGGSGTGGTVNACPGSGGGGGTSGSSPGGDGIVVIEW